MGPDRRRLRAGGRVPEAGRRAGHGPPGSDPAMAARRGRRRPRAALGPRLAPRRAPARAPPRRLLAAAERGTPPRGRLARGGGIGREGGLLARPEPAAGHRGRLQGHGRRTRVQRGRAVAGDELRAGRVQGPPPVAASGHGATHSREGGGASPPQPRPGPRGAVRVRRRLRSLGRHPDGRVAGEDPPLVPGQHPLPALPSRPADGASRRRTPPAPGRRSSTSGTSRAAPRRPSTSRRSLRPTSGAA